MTTPTGAIGMSDVNIEIGRAYNTPINLNEAPVRSLAGVSSGAISMNNLRGKSSIPPLSASIDQGSFFGSAMDYGSGATARTANATITITGGSGTVSYQWYINGGGAISNGTAASPYFAYSGGAYSGASGDVWCVVTKGGQSVTTATRPYSLDIQSSEI